MFEVTFKSGNKIYIRQHVVDAMFEGAKGGSIAGWQGILNEEGRTIGLFLLSSVESIMQISANEAVEG